jgi:hypothetical protein
MIWKPDLVRGWKFRFMLDRRAVEDIGLVLLCLIYVLEWFCITECPGKILWKSLLLKALVVAKLCAEARTLVEEDGGSWKT